MLGVKIDKGHGIGYWVSLLAVLVGTGLAVKRFTDTGGKLPSSRLNHLPATHRLDSGP